MPGTNAKMNEMQALMGSLVLKYLDDLIQKRACDHEPLSATAQGGSRHPPRHRHCHPT